MTRLILFGTLGCHLCDEAEQLLSKALCKCSENFDLKNIDIADHEHWQTQYAIRIPILYHPKTRLELGWPFDAKMLDRFLNELHQHD